MKPLAFTTEILEPASRLRLNCQEQMIDIVIDQLCSSLQCQGIAEAHLSPHPGSMVANINIRENLWLPLAWRKAVSLEEMDASLAGLISLLKTLLGSDLAVSLSTMLNGYPGDLTPELLSWAVLLRAALMQPQCVVIDPAWLRPTGREDCCVPPAAMDALLGGSTWLVVAAAEQQLAGPWAWRRLRSDQLAAL